MCYSHLCVDSDAKLSRLYNSKLELRKICSDRRKEMPVKVQGGAGKTGQPSRRST
jgi:hypothetical protein